MTPNTVPAWFVARNRCIAVTTCDVSIDRLAAAATGMLSSVVVAAPVTCHVSVVIPARTSGRALNRAIKGSEITPLAENVPRSIHAATRPASSSNAKGSNSSVRRGAPRAGVGMTSLDTSGEGPPPCGLYTNRAWRVR